MHRIKFVICIITVLSPLVFAEQFPWLDANYNYRIKASVDSGMYIRKNYVLSVDINFQDLLKNSIDANHIRVFDQETQKEVPSIAKPAVESGGGNLIAWLMQGKVEPLSEKQYFIYFGGSGEIPEKSNRPAEFNIPPTRHNLISNPDFEENGHWLMEGKGCEFSDKEMHNGKRSLRINNSKPSENDCYSDIFEMKPNHSYLLSSWFKVSKFAANNDGCLLIELTFLDKNQKPRTPPAEENYRALLGLSVSPAEEDAANFLGKWVYEKFTFTTPEWVNYGKVRLRGYKFIGEGYFDEIRLCERMPEKPKIVLGKAEVRPGFSAN